MFALSQCFDSSVVYVTTINIFYFLKTSHTRVLSLIVLHL